MIIRTIPLFFCLLLGACGVSRELVIDTEPQGARVFMDREDLGTTPIRMNYEYGGMREFVILHEEGELKYKPVRLRSDTGEFFLDTFPFDVFARIQPTRIERELLVSVTLEESTQVEELMLDEEGYVNSLMNRAEAMRERARRAQEEGEPAAPSYFPAPAEEADAKADAKADEKQPTQP